MEANENQNNIIKDLNDAKFIKGIFECCKVLEGGLSRVYGNMKRPFTVITAFRGENDVNRNRELNAALMVDMRKNKLGGKHMVGHYVENLGKPNEKRVTEESFFISLNDKCDLTPEQFKDFSIGMMKKYKQDSLVYGDGTNTFYIKKDGTESDLGKSISLDNKKMSEYWSRVKGKKFIFEGTTEPTSVISAHILGSWGLFGDKYGNMKVC